MRKLGTLIIGIGVGVFLSLSSCTESVNDYPDAARVSGWIYTDQIQSQGVSGVAVLLEADQESDTPYMGPDRWFYTDENGHFEGSLFLGSEHNPTTGKITYHYVADVSISYYYQDKAFTWSGGATVQAGGNFICPSVNLTQFVTIGMEGGG